VADSSGTTEGARTGVGAPSGLPRRDRRAELGSVTAETAVVLPVLVALTLGLVWVVSLAVAQVRVVDAARETARALARDESADAAVRLGEQVAPEGSRISVEQGDTTVTVRVVAEVSGPGGLFSFLPGVLVDADAVAAKEPS
jgi:hypothetical protein